MQLARSMSQMPSLARLGTPRVASYLPSFRHSFVTSSGLRNKADDRDPDLPAGTELRGLPAPSPEEAQKLDVNSGDGIRFDHLGPIVVNKDGTMSRITNWDKMAPIERENTLRILGKRNKARTQALKEKQEKEGGSGSS